MSTVLPPWLHRGQAGDSGKNGVLLIGRDVEPNPRLFLREPNDEDDSDIAS